LVGCRGGPGVSWPDRRCDPDPSVGGGDEVRRPLMRGTDEEFGPVASPPGEPGRPARRCLWKKPPGLRARSRCAPRPMTPSDPAAGAGDGPAVDAPAASCPTPGDCSSGNGSAPRGRGDHLERGRQSSEEREHLESRLSEGFAEWQAGYGRGLATAADETDVDDAGGPQAAVHDRREQPHSHARPGTDDLRQAIDQANTARGGVVDPRKPWNVRRSAL
jgi:hypothetical protein